jgi:hypothetical protein
MEYERSIFQALIVVKWYDLLEAAEDDQRDYLEVVKRRAPKEDPRIRELEEKKIV